MIKVIVVDDERFVRMGIVGETDWASRARSSGRKSGSRQIGGSKEIPV